MNTGTTFVGSSLARAKLVFLRKATFNVLQAEDNSRYRYDRAFGHGDFDYRQPIEFRRHCKRSAFERVRSTGTLFSTMVADAVISRDLATLDAMIENSLTNDELIYIRVRNASGTVLSENGEASILQAPFVSDRDFQSALTDHMIDISAPISIAGQNFGSVEIGVSTLRVESEMATALRWNLMVAAIGMSLVAVFGYLLGSILTAQLSSLREGARMITSGDLGYQIDVRGRDELADTARCFNAMAVTLAKDRSNLEQRQCELLDKRDRTNSIVESMKERGGPRFLTSLEPC